MTSDGSGEAGARARVKPEEADFFVSRAGANAWEKELAIWIARLLESHGHKVLIQDLDFGPKDFVSVMHRALAGKARVIALLSAAYMHSKDCMQEAQGALDDGRDNDHQRLVILRIERVKAKGILAHKAYTDLVPYLSPRDAAGLERAILDAIATTRPDHPGGLPTLDSGQVLHPEIAPVKGFTGRVDPLAALSTALWGVAAAGTDGAPTGDTRLAAILQAVPASPTTGRNDDGATAALSGLGGVGKSTLARHYAWTNRERYAHIWWLRAESAATLIDDLIALGARLFDPTLPEQKDRAGAAAKVVEWLSSERFAKPILLVYDNVADPADIRGFTPAACCHVLATSRHPDWVGEALEVRLGVFQRMESVAYLMARARVADAMAADALAETLGDLPLALAQARAYAWGANLSFAEVRPRIAELIEKASRRVDYPRSVAATYTLAVAQAAAACPDAARLMGLLAYVAPDEIPLDLFVRAADAAEAEDGAWDGTLPQGALDAAVTALAEAALVEPVRLSDGTAGVSVHRMVQMVVRAALPAGAGAAIAVRRVAAAFPSGSNDVRFWPACQRLAAHAAAVLAHAPRTGEDSAPTARLMGKLSLYQQARADYAVAEPLVRDALAIDEARLGPNHPTVAIRLNNLAMLLQATNRLAEAEPLMRRALASDEASYGKDHPKVAIRLNNLAMLLQATNRLAEAEPLMRRALVLSEASYGPDHPNVAIRLNNLALLLRATNRLAEAEPHLVRVIEIFEKVERETGHQDPNYAGALNNLALHLQDTHRLAEAEPLMRRALAIDEASLGPDHPNVAIRLNNLALLLKATNRLAEAEPLMRRALAIDEASLGPDHPNVGLRLGSIGILLQAMDRGAESLGWIERAVANLDRSGLPDHHPWVQGARQNLASLQAELRAGGPQRAAPPPDAAPSSPPSSASPSPPSTGKPWWKRLLGL